MILPIPKGTSLAVAKKILTRTVNDLFADSQWPEKIMAINAGHYELERGTPFFEAVEIAEGVIRAWEEVVRNCDRLTAYRQKLNASAETQNGGRTWDEK